METCTKCGSPVDAAQWYCSECGSPLGIGVVRTGSAQPAKGRHGKHSSDEEHAHGEHAHGEHRHHRHHSSNKPRWIRLRGGELRMKPATAVSLVTVAVLLISAAYLVGRYVR